VNGDIRYQSNVDQAIRQIEAYLEPKGSDNYNITIDAPTMQQQNRKKKGPGGSTLGERNKGENKD
jgi:hypothetical protein